jgi:predicted permease
MAYSGGSPHRPGGRGYLSPIAALSDYFRWDLRLALRNLARSPAFVVVSLLSLAFGIGTSTVLFTVANAALLRPAPWVADSGELVRIVSTSRGSPRGPNAYPDFEDYRRGVEGLEDAAAFRGIEPAATTTSGEARLLRGLEVSENYFNVLGIPLTRGRGFLPEDVAAGGEVAVIGHAVWERDFGADPGILGRTIRLNGRLHTIVGVAPRGMTALDDPVLVDVLVPVTEARQERRHRSLRVVGRLREGVTPERLQAALDGLARRLVEEHPEAWNHLGDDPRGLRAIPEARARIPEEPPLGLVMGGFLAVVGLILLITCSNVANLLLSRGLRRGPEVAIRSAIGASRRRILLQLLTENVLLFGGAGGVGLVLAHLLAEGIQSGWPALSLPSVNLEMDVRVAAFAVGITLVTALSFGLLPAVHASRTDLVSALKGAGPGGRIRRLSPRSLLVGAQVAGSLVLVLITLLLVQGLDRAREMDLGFEPARVAVLSMDLSHRGYGEEDGRGLLASLMERLASLPGVEGVALGTWIPLQGGGTYYGGLEPEGYRTAPQEHVNAAFAAVTPGYLEVVGMRLSRGRDFAPEDRADGAPVALVNQAFVDRYWPGESGVGKRIGMRGTERRVEVVGVVADSRYQMVTETPMPHLWFPFAQAYQGDVVVHVRAGGDPGALLPHLRQQLREMDPDLPILRLDRMDAITANATAPQRLLSRVLAGAGVVALALAMLGIYGVVGYSVSQRTREVGLRIALGARPRRVAAMVVGEGVALSLVGLLPGITLGVGAALVVRSLLLGVDPLSPLAVAGSAGVLLVAAAMASLAPALRAARADPMESLRGE